MTVAPELEAIRFEIAGLYATHGERAYGLYHINQVQHALQAATLAEAKGLGSAMVMACLLHDIGHMVHDLGEAPAEQGIDDRHEVRGANWAFGIFGPDVSEPIRLHVAAKRYLCTTEPGYEAGLAKDSVISLALQGGRMNEAEEGAFVAEPYAADAIALRRIDELAKDPRAVTPTIEEVLARHFLPAFARRDTSSAA